MNHFTPDLSQFKSGVKWFVSPQRQFKSVPSGFKSTLKKFSSELSEFSSRLNKFTSGHQKFKSAQQTPPCGPTKDDGNPKVPPFSPNSKNVNCSVAGPAAAVRYLSPIATTYRNAMTAPLLPALVLPPLPQAEDAAGATV